MVDSNNTSSGFTDDRASVKVRRDDYEAMQRYLRQLPISFLDLFSAMRIAWDSLPEKKRLQALEQVAAAANAA